MSEKLPATPRDYRQEVTDSIVRLLEEGTAPWQKPWNATGLLVMPMNPTSGKNYRGGNALYLLAIALKHGYDDPRWMTYRQAQENDWQVRRGERGIQIEYWDVKRVTTGEPEPGQAEEDDATPDKPQKRLIHKIYTVFHASQIADIPEYPVRKHTAFEAEEAGEKILTNSGAAIFHDQLDSAFYNRRTDEIHLPRRAFFTDAPGYYGTALHELAHWTGHPSRLNRSTLNEAYKFGDTNHAKEELRAELASVFLAAERGIPHDPDRHAAYVANWIQGLKNDKNEIFRAASDAAKATDYILALERGQAVTAEEAPEEAPIESSSPITHAERASRVNRGAKRQRG